MNHKGEKLLKLQFPQFSWVDWLFLCPAVKFMYRGAYFMLNFKIPSSVYVFFPLRWYPSGPKRENIRNALFVPKLRPMITVGSQ